MEPCKGAYLGKAVAIKKHWMIGLAGRCCMKVLPIRSLVQYLFATPKPLKARPCPS